MRMSYCFEFMHSRIAGWLLENLSEVAGCHRFEVS